MEHEAELAAALVGLADTLADDFDPKGYLRTLADRCVGLLSADAVGVVLTDADGALSVTCASSDSLAALELVGFTNESGPLLEAYQSGEQVHASRLADHEARWPGFVGAARAAGVESVFVFPMRRLAHTIGVLALFSFDPGPLPESELPIAQSMAEAATVGLLQERAIRQRDEMVAQLQHALEARIVIEQAKGILVATARVAPEDAFEALRRLARSRRVHVHEVARSLIDQTLSAEAIAAQAEHSPAGGSGVRTN